MASNQEILAKAIHKAIDGGWNYGNGYEYCSRHFRGGTNINVGADESPLYIPHIEADYYYIIYNHNFAKALWPDKSRLGERGESFEMWKYHLQKMVIAGDPIKYLGENI